jgi:hypothetical protein
MTFGLAGCSPEPGDTAGAHAHDVSMIAAARAKANIDRYAATARTPAARHSNAKALTGK